jgi:hypothetical protein
MYQKRILPYFIIPYFLTPSFFPSGELRTEGQTNLNTPCYLSSFFFTERGALPAGATLLGWPNYGVDGRLNKNERRPNQTPSSEPGRGSSRTYYFLAGEKKSQNENFDDHNISTI